MELDLAIQPSDYFRTELPTPWIENLKTNKAFKLFVPKKYNGLELDLETGVDYLIKSAQLHPGLGWVHNLCAGANYFCGCFDDKTAQTIFSTQGVLTSGSGTPSGSFTKSKDGYLIQGEWNKCSGSAHATYFTVVANDTTNVPQAFIVPREEVTLKKSWSSFGLQSTSSDTILLNNAFVPTAYAFEIGTLKNHANYIVYRYSYEFFARVCLSGTYEGITRLFLNQLTELLAFKAEKIKEQLAELNDNINKLNELRKTTILQCNEHIENQKLNQMEMDAFYKASYAKLAQQHYSIYQTVMETYWKGGIQISEVTNPLNALLKDFMTASQHYMLK